MTKTAQKTKAATTTDPIRRFWYDDELPFQSLAYQAKKLFELSSARRHPEEFDDITPYIDWLWANEPEDARKLQLELLLLEVMEETVDCQHSPTARLESKRAAHQGNLKGSILDADPPALQCALRAGQFHAAVLTVCRAW